MTRVDSIVRQLSRSFGVIVMAKKVNSFLFDVYYFYRKVYVGTSKVKQNYLMFTVLVRYL